MTQTILPALEQALRQALPAPCFRPAEPRYFEEPRGRYSGTPGLVLAPATAHEVSHIVGLANQFRTPVIPYGGGTGLVGGQTGQGETAPLIVTFDRMRAIRATYPTENVIVVEAGAILAEVQEAAEDLDRLFPLSLASEGSARIGGLLATNAGGVNVLRYGNARDLCLGIEAVLPDGQIWNGLTRLRKNNTGYDLRHLMIGSEGTLGLITAAALRLVPRPVAEGTAFLTVSDPAAALDLLALAGGQLGQQITAFELIHRQGFDFLAETLPDIRHPFKTPPEWCVLIEIGLGAGQDAAGALETLFAAALDQGLVSDGVVAQTAQQRQDFWSVREHIPEANRRIGSVSSHDISVPLSTIPEFIARAGPQLAQIDSFRINCFGHVGDGNLHYNVFPQPGRSRADHDHQRVAIKRCIHDLVHALGGSVSAEHGVGRLKVDDIERYSDPAKLSAMRAIKRALDPNGIMNPGAVLRAEE